MCIINTLYFYYTFMESELDDDWSGKRPWNYSGQLCENVSAIYAALKMYIPYLE